MELAGRRATVMGLGCHGGGVAAARFLAAEGALVTVTDLADEAALAPSLEALAALPGCRFRLGGHREVDFRRRGADVVVINPAVRPDHPLVALARSEGLVVTSEIELFLARCPAMVVGVTGTNGKSTTAAMTAAIASADGRRTWLGGNIGRSLLTELDRIAEDDCVVLELSSFQLHWLGPQVPLPQISMVTGCAPNHLDWHRDFADYRRAKQRLLEPHRSGASPGVAILNLDDAEVARWAAGCQRQVVAPLPMEALPALRVPGDHNRRNAASAAAAALAAGCGAGAIERGLVGFTGLPHRLQSLGQWAGRHVYNDSKATTPGAVIAALETLAALDRPIWLVAGGKAKGVPLDELAAAICQHASGLCCYGADGQELRERVAACLAGGAGGKSPLVVSYTPRLEDAAGWCWQQSQPGDAILLSPACASFDQFRSYEHRGTAFADCIARLAGQPHEYVTGGTP